MSGGTTEKSMSKWDATRRALPAAVVEEQPILGAVGTRQVLIHQQLAMRAALTEELQ